MNICFYAPFKPLTHPDPSGDQTIGRDLYAYLARKGHRVWTAGTLRCRWIYWKPWQFSRILLEGFGALRRVRRNGPDVWLTYHTYYKAPDLLGPAICRRTKVPYVIFQGVYSTKRRRRVRTWPGFVLNIHALRTAEKVFTNKRKDLKNLKRIVPADRLTYVSPGVDTGAFMFSERERAVLRSAWGAGEDPVVLSAAMFRAGVKSEGIALVIRACGRLARTGKRFHLVIAGDGKMKHDLVRLADEVLPGRVRFVGKVSRAGMQSFYSAGDLFAFPGIRESLGMVYLEAQSCELPVVAFSNGGTPEVIRHRETGILAPAYDFDAFETGIEILLDSPDLRRHMGRKARAYVRSAHDLETNYALVEKKLQEVVVAR
jgi:glycosyltransferase involved in cell wall biosynthesis